MVDGDRSLPWFWSLGSAVAHVIFGLGVLSTLWTSHLRSFDALSLRPTDDFARAVEDSRPVLTIVMMVGVTALGIVAGARMARGDWKIPAARLALLAVAPVIVELTAVGVQDGSPNDLDLVPTHTLVMLAVLVLGVLGSIVDDVIRLRRPVEA